MGSTSTGELSLWTLLRTLTIVQHPATYVFATVPTSTQLPFPLSDVLLIFREPCTSSSTTHSTNATAAEMTTLILTQDIAITHSVDHTFPSKMLTCNVHSSLDAVGFMAEMSRVLTEEGIGCNVIAGYFHDHLFVPVDKVGDAVRVLEGLKEQALRLGEE
jgi:uncharacterized protein